VPVVFTADLLVKSFADNSAVHHRIQGIAGEHLDAFYAPKRTWETVIDSGKIFRRKAGEILGKDGPALITACLQRDKHGTPKSATRIEWDRAEPTAAVNSHEATQSK
jgi:hypothetical protein